MAHNRLAVTASGCLPGLSHQILFTPRKAPPRSTAKSARPADRGADVTEFLDYADEHRTECVVRIDHNRRVLVGDTTAAEPHEMLRAQAALGRRIREVPAHAGRPARDATVVIRAASVSLVTPRQPRGRERGVPLPVVAIRAWEVDPVGDHEHGGRGSRGDGPPPSPLPNRVARIQSGG